MRHILALVSFIAALVGNLSRASAADVTTEAVTDRLSALDSHRAELRLRGQWFEDPFVKEAQWLHSTADTEAVPSVFHFSDEAPASDEQGQAADHADAANDLSAGMQQLEAGLEGLGQGVEQLGAGVEELAENLTVTTAEKEYGFKLALFGAATGEMLFAEERPIIPSAITLITPDFGNDSQTVEVHAKSSYLGAALIGPKVGCFESGGLVLGYFYGENVLDDLPGLFLARFYGELKNDHWRFLVGLEGDIVVPLYPTTLSWTVGNGTGNMGYQRGQFRVESYFYPSSDSQMTIQLGLTDPTVTSFANFSLTEGLQEDNGWPNIEGRLAYGYGPRRELAGEQKRTVEVGLSGVVGQLRRTTLGPPAVADVWAYGLDVFVQLTDWCGFKAEFFDGQTIGTYNAAIVQNFNANRQGIRATGGWGEVYVYWNPCLHSHFGYSVDDPHDSDLTAGLPSRNEWVFGNIIWDVTKSIEVGFEVSHWATDYRAPLGDNETFVFHSRVRIRF